MDLPFSRRSAQRIRARRAGSLLAARSSSRSASGSPTRAGRSSAAAGACPSVEVLDEYTAAADVEALCRRRPLHRRARARAPHARQARRDPAARPATRSSSPRTSASTSTPASTGSACPARSCANITRAQLRRGLLDDHDAARAQHLPRAHHAREDARAQAQGSQGRARDRGAVLEGQDPRALPEPDLPRQRRVRRRDRVAALLRQVGARPEPRRGGDARRAAQGAGALQSAPLPRARDPAPQHGHRAHAARRRDQRRRREPRQGVSAAARAARPSRATSRRTSSSGSASSSTQQFGQQLYEQGLKVYTTLDLDMQSAAERALENQLRAIEAGRFGTFPHQTYEQYIARARRRRRARRAELAVPAGRVRRDRSAHRRRARAGRRPRLRRLEVQSRDAGAAPAGLDVQADRLRRRRSRTAGRRRTSSTTRRSRVPQVGGDDVDAAELRRQVRGPDADAARRSTSRATSSRSSVGMELGEQTVIDDGAQVRHHDADSALSVDPHRRRPTSIRSR